VIDATFSRHWFARGHCRHSLCGGSSCCHRPRCVFHFTKRDSCCQSGCTTTLLPKRLYCHAVAVGAALSRCWQSCCTVMLLPNSPPRLLKPLPKPLHHHAVSKAALSCCWRSHCIATTSNVVCRDAFANNAHRRFQWALSLCFLHCPAFSLWQISSIVLQRVSTEQLFTAPRKDLCLCASSLLMAWFSASSFNYLWQCNFSRCCIIHSRSYLQLDLHWYLAHHHQSPKCHPSCFHFFPFFPIHSFNFRSPSRRHANVQMRFILYVQVLLHYYAIRNSYETIYFIEFTRHRRAVQ